MSVRAYRINKIKYKSEDTFNLWHNTKLTNFFEKEGFYNWLNQDGVGITELSVKALKGALGRTKDLELDDFIIKAIKQDIAWAKKRGDDYIQYYCF